MNACNILPDKSLPYSASANILGLSDLWSADMSIPTLGVEYSPLRLPVLRDPCRATRSKSHAMYRSILVDEYLYTHSVHTTIIRVKRHTFQFSDLIACPVYTCVYHLGSRESGSLF